MDLATARSELKDIIGADLEPAEADRYLNDGNKELCVRAEWTRATLDLGTTVAGQRDYDLPANVYRPLKLRVNGLRFGPSDEDEIDNLTAGFLNLSPAEAGKWWIRPDASGVEKFALYPTPTQAGLAIEALCVVFPPLLEEDTDEFTPPEDFHQAAVYYAAMQSLGGSEDDFDARAMYQDQFDGLVGRLRRLRKMRTGTGPVRMRIEGRTA